MLANHIFLEVYILVNCGKLQSPELGPYYIHIYIYYSQLTGLVIF